MRTRTFVELEAAVGGRARAGVVDWLLVQVVSNENAPPELHKQLYQIGVLGLSGVVKGRLVELGSVHVCSWEK